MEDVVSDFCDHRKHAYSFWELHRMLADCYVADVAESQPLGSAQLRVLAGQWYPIPGFVWLWIPSSSNQTNRVPLLSYGYFPT